MLRSSCWCKWDEGGEKSHNNVNESTHSTCCIPLAYLLSLTRMNHKLIGKWGKWFSERFSNPVPESRHSGPLTLNQCIGRSAVSSNAKNSIRRFAAPCGGCTSPVEGPAVGGVSAQSPVPVAVMALETG